VSGLELQTERLVLRLPQLEDARAAVERSGRDPAELAAYLEAFAFGLPPHGGCRFSLEAVLAAITGEPDLRRVSLFPRDLEHLSP